MLSGGAVLDGAGCDVVGRVVVVVVTVVGVLAFVPLPPHPQSGGVVVCGGVLVSHPQSDEGIVVEVVGSQPQFQPPGSVGCRH